MRKAFLRTALAAPLALALAASASAKVDLVTLPAREKVELTIYNSADLTLVRDTRSLTMRKGDNRLQYSWAGTLIDPTSLELSPKSDAGAIRTLSVEYPPRVTGLGIWNLESDVSGKVPFEITCFTSGLTWRAYYVATLTPDESAMALEGYVRVDNNSGEDYEGASTRVVVGRINLLDEIVDLARRRYPYGRPEAVQPMAEAVMRKRMAPMAEEAAPMASARAFMDEMRPKEIVKEGLSEYFLYSIEGTEDLMNGWGTRLVSFTAPSVPVVNLYRYEEESYGDRPVRYLSFANDEKHELGREPIPDGMVMVFREGREKGSLSFVGSQPIKYVPKGSEVDMNLGATARVVVKPVLMDLETDNYEWRKVREDDVVTGWDETRTWRVEVGNYQAIPARVEIRRNLGGTKWELTNQGDVGEYTRIDADTVQYLLDLKPFETREFTYKVTLKTGSRGM